MKKSFLILCLIVFFGSCKKQNSKNNKIKESIELKVKPTSSKFINFNSYSFNSVEGFKEKIKLQKNKKYILDFWYLECLPCVRDHKKIETSKEKLNQNNIEIIGISIDRNKTKWKEYLNKHSYNWKNYNQYDDNINLKDDLKIKVFPTYLIIDDDGNIKEKFNSFELALNYFKYN